MKKDSRIFLFVSRLVINVKKGVEQQKCILHIFCFNFITLLFTFFYVSVPVCVAMSSPRLTLIVVLSWKELSLAFLALSVQLCDLSGKHSFLSFCIYTQKNLLITGDWFIYCTIGIKKSFNTKLKLWKEISCYLMIKQIKTKINNTNYKVYFIWGRLWVLKVLSLTIYSYILMLY